MKTVEDIQAEIQRLETQLASKDLSKFHVVRITDKIKVLNWVLEKWKCEHMKK